MTKSFYIFGQKNIQIKNPEKFKINVTGFQGVNCKSHMEFHKTNNSFDFIKILINYKILNIENKTVISLLKDVINNVNLKDDEIKKYLSEKNLDLDSLRDKINEKLYDDSSKQKTIEAVEKTCKKENINNPRKIDYQKRKNLIENLDTDEIKKSLSKEKRINIVLDNYRVHHAKIVEKACKILNIHLIFLPPYSPFLNPIEDVWRKIKKEIYKSYLKSLDHLKNLFKEAFHETIDDKTLYEEWLETYI